MTPLDRITHDLAAIDAVNLEEDMSGEETIADHATCMAVDLRPLLPLLREWTTAHAAWAAAVDASEFAGRPIDIDIIGYHSDTLREVDRALLAALRGKP